MPFLSNCTGYRNYKFPRGYQKSNIRRLEKHFLVWRVSISDLDDKVVLSINSWGWWWLCNDMGVIFQVRIIYIQPTWVLFLTMSGLLWPHCASSWWLLSKSLVARKIGNRCRDLLECVKEIQCIWQKQYSTVLMRSMCVFGCFFPDPGVFLLNWLCIWDYCHAEIWSCWWSDAFHMVCITDRNLPALSCIHNSRIFCEIINTMAEKCNPQTIAEPPTFYRWLHTLAVVLPLSILTINHSIISVASDFQCSCWVIWDTLAIPQE